VAGSRAAKLPARAVCWAGTAAVGWTPGLLAQLVRGRGGCTSSGRRLPDQCSSSGRQWFGTSGPFRGERRQGLPCIALVVSGDGR
jgi:hypothetical protein